MQAPKHGAVEEVWVTGVASTLEVSALYSIFLEVIVNDFLLDFLLNPRVVEESIDSLSQGGFTYNVLEVLVDHFSMYFESIFNSITSSFLMASIPNIEAKASFSWLV